MAEPLIVGGISFILMIALSLMGLPIFVTLGLVGILGLIYDVGLNSTMGIVSTLPFAVLASYGMAVVPLFYLMGDMAGEAGIAEDAYKSAHKMFAGIRGGLAMSTTLGCAFFGACMGSSIANAALFTRIAYPEMRRYNYDKAFAAGTIAAAGTLAILIPPSITMVIYGIVTEESIGRLLVAGVIPGILTALAYMTYIGIACRVNPRLAPVQETVNITWKERIGSLRGIWGIALLFLLIIGGLYTGIFTPTSAGAVGAFGAIILALAKKKLNKQTIGRVSLSSVTGVATILVCLIGGFLFARHLVLSGFVDQLIIITTVHAGLQPWVIVAFICVMYIFLGCVMDPISMLVVTLPFIYPVVTGLGYDGIWFGVIFVVLTEIALLTPPVGANLYVVAAAAGPDTDIADVIRGVLPFILVQFVVLAILIAFPQISLFLPNAMFGK